MPNIISISEMSLDDIERKYGVKAKMGKISVVRGKYYFTVEAKRSELNPNFIFSSQPIGKILRKGTVAGGIIIDDRPVVIIVNPGRPPKRPPIVCYIPVPDIRSKIDRMVRIELIKMLVKEKRIASALGKQLLNEIKEL